MAYMFTTPSVKEAPLGNNRLFWRYGLDRGVSVYREAGEWYETRYPNEDEITSHDLFFLGGHNHVITDTAVANELINLGYSVVPI